MKLSVQITSIPDREDIVAELWQEFDMIGELQKIAHNQFVLEIYTKGDGSPWQINLDDWLVVLAEAKRRLS